MSLCIYAYTCVSACVVVAVVVRDVFRSMCEDENVDDWDERRCWKNGTEINVTNGQKEIDLKVQHMNVYVTSVCVFVSVFVFVRFGFDFVKRYIFSWRHCMRYSFVPYAPHNLSADFFFVIVTRHSNMRNKVFFMSQLTILRHSHTSNRIHFYLWLLFLLVSLSKVFVSFVFTSYPHSIHSQSHSHSHFYIEPHR